MHRACRTLSGQIFGHTEGYTLHSEQKLLPRGQQQQHIGFRGIFCTRYRKGMLQKERGHTGKWKFSEFFSSLSPTIWQLPQFSVNSLGRGALKCPLGSSSNSIFLVICDTLCIISLSLTRCMACLSLSREHSASMASISLSSGCSSIDLLLRFNVSGRTILNVSLNVAIMSSCERWGGSRIFSRVLKTAFRVLADED